MTRVPHNGAAVSFTMICLLGMLLILVGLGLEWSRVRNGSSLLGVRVFQWRVVSGLVWLIMLGTFAYATWFLWPAPGDKEMAHRFLAAIGKAGLLMVLATALLFADLWIVMRERRRQQARLQRQMSDLVQEARTRPQAPDAPER